MNRPTVSAVRTGEFRKFMELVDEAGELLRIREEVDWKYGIGERTRALSEGEPSPPAILFENVTGYPGARVLTNVLASRSRLNLVLGLDPHTPYEELVGCVRERTRRPIPAEEVALPQPEGGLTDDCDLTKLPVPWWSRADAGRYLGTWHLNISNDPDTGTRNVGVYRMQLLGPRTAAVSVSPRSDLARQFARAEREGRGLEMAVAIGVDERLVMAAGMAAPFGVDEYSFAGALIGRPVRVRTGATVALEVPFDAEIVIEGVIVPHRRIHEGPFVDYAGIAKGNPAGLVFEVSSMSLRRDAIFRGAAIGYRGAEDHILYRLLASADSLDFHGSRIRHFLQQRALRHGRFAEFQLLGRCGQEFRRLLRRR